MLKDDDGIPSSFDKNFTKPLFALPFVGGSKIYTSIDFGYKTIFLCDDLVCTYKERKIDPS